MKHNNHEPNHKNDKRPAVIKLSQSDMDKALAEHESKIAASRKADFMDQVLDQYKEGGSIVELKHNKVYVNGKVAGRFEEVGGETIFHAGEV